MRYWIYCHRMLVSRYVSKRMAAIIFENGERITPKNSVITTMLGKK